MMTNKTERMKSAMLHLVTAQETVTDPILTAIDRYRDALRALGAASEDNDCFINRGHHRPRVAIGFTLDFNGGRVPNYAYDMDQLNDFIAWERKAVIMSGLFGGRGVTVMEDRHRRLRAELLFGSACFRKTAHGLAITREFEAAKAERQAQEALVAIQPKTFEGALALTAYIAAEGRGVLQDEHLEHIIANLHAFLSKIDDEAGVRNAA